MKDKSGKTVKKTAVPNFKNKASIRRYSTALSVYLDEVTKQKDDIPELQRKYISAITNTLSQRILQTQKSANEIDVKIYLYDFPRIMEFKKGDKKGRLILIKQERYEK